MQLKNTIDTMSTRMDTFESTLTSKIDALENNYNELNSKIEVMSTKAYSQANWLTNHKIYEKL